MPNGDQVRVINASPSKKFFIETLVKDIDLIDAILDLIDNSIDSHIKHDFSERKDIKIALFADRFQLEDNCGGIPKDEVYEHVFRLGTSDETSERTIGVYGIGLKRAVFKIGKNILIESDDGTSKYSILIDKAWLRDEDNWKLHFAEESISTGKRFTRITITDLYPNITDDLKNPVFVNALNEKIRNTYTFLIQNRVDIWLNDLKVEPYIFRFLEEPNNFAPYHKTHDIEGVQVEIFAGFTPGGRQKWPFGWYVFCNERLIVANDTSERTGWDIYRKYHYPEDDRVLGIVIFRSTNPSLLPWQTTKDDIQIDSRIYRQAQDIMRAITRRLTNVIREAGRLVDPDMGETVGKSIFEDVPTKSVNKITEEQDEILPIVDGVPSIAFDALRKPPTNTYVQFIAKRELVKKVKEKLGNSYMSNKEMGEMTFKYFIEMEDVEDE